MKFRYKLPTLYVGISLTLFFLADVVRVGYLQDCGGGDFFAWCMPTWTLVPFYLSFPGLILPVVVAFVLMNYFGIAESVFWAIVFGGGFICSLALYYVIGRTIETIMKVVNKHTLQG